MATNRGGSSKRSKTTRGQSTGKSTTRATSNGRTGTTTRASKGSTTMRAGTNTGRNATRRSTTTRSKNVEEWSRDDLYQRAKELSIQGRSKMNKQQLLKAVRNK